MKKIQISTLGLLAVLMFVLTMLMRFDLGWWGVANQMFNLTITQYSNIIDIVSACGYGLLVGVYVSNTTLIKVK